MDAGFRSDRFADVYEHWVVVESVCADHGLYEMGNMAQWLKSHPRVFIPRVHSEYR